MREAPAFPLVLPFNIQHLLCCLNPHHPTCSRSREGLCILAKSSCSCCCTDRSSPSTFGSFFGCCAPPGCGVGCGFCCGRGPRSCCDPLPPACCFCIASLRRRAISRFRLAAASEGRIRNASV